MATVCTLFVMILALRVVDSIEEPSIKYLGQRAGYYPIKKSYPAKMFYFYFESRGRVQTDPVVLWLAGGPGCGSEVAVFYENGPFNMKDDMTLAWNTYGWDTVSNLIYVDQPKGTGFSNCTDSCTLHRDQASVTTDLYDFLKSFFEEHPELVKNDFYLTGQSHAGHYIPSLASKIMEENQSPTSFKINLKGFAIGNGFTNAWYQYPSILNYAKSLGLISDKDYQEIQSIIPDCLQEIQKCQIDEQKCDIAWLLCDGILKDILFVAPDINYYDVRKPCVDRDCYNMSNLYTFLNSVAVREALGVGNLNFDKCNNDVYRALRHDIPKNYDTMIPPLLESGLKVLIYAGEYDLICDWLGNLRWLDALAWSGQKNFSAATMSPYTVDGKVAGSVKTYGPLTFFKVYDAGHLVPMDQPSVALHMIKGWMDETSRQTIVHRLALSLNTSPCRCHKSYDI